MLVAGLLACSAPVDPSPWVGTWFGTVDFWTGDVDHWRTVLLRVSATGEAMVPVHAIGSAWAAHDEATLVCDGIAGGEPPREGLVLICEMGGHAAPVVLALNGIDSDSPDHVEGQAAEVPDDIVAPDVTARSYDAWEALADDSCVWWSPFCAAYLDRALDGVTERTLDTSSLVSEATVSCAEDLGPWPTFRGEVDSSVTGVLLEFAMGGEVVFYSGLDPGVSGSLSWDGYPMGGMSDTCDEITTSLYASTATQFQDLERIDL